CKIGRCKFPRPREHGCRDVDPEHMPPRTHAPRKLDCRCATSAADIDHALTRNHSSSIEQRLRDRRENAVLRSLSADPATASRAIRMRRLMRGSFVDWRAMHPNPPCYGACKASAPAGTPRLWLSDEVPQSVQRSSESDAGSAVTPLEMFGIGICQSVSM